MSFPIHGKAVPMLSEEEQRLHDALLFTNADIHSGLYWIQQYAGTLSQGIESHPQHYLDYCEERLNEQWRLYRKALALRQDHEQRLKEIRPNE